MIEFIPLHGGSAAGIMPAAAGISGAAYADSQGRMAPLTGAAGDRARGSGTGIMAPLEGISGGAYADSRGLMAPLEGFGYAGLAAPDYVIADTYLPPLTGMGVMMSGTIGEVDGEMAPLIGLSANRPYGEARAVLAALTGFSGELTHGTFILDPRQTRLTATNAQTERIRVASSSSRALIIPQEHTQRVQISDPRVTKLMAQTSNRHRLLIVSRDEVARMVNVTIDGIPRTVQAEPDKTWCFNADTYAAARLEYHGFNSFVLHQGRYYMASDAGIFEIGGDSYDGISIDSVIAFGGQLFGSEQLKRFIRAYLAGDSEGLMTLAVQDDKGSPVYRYNAEVPLSSRAETRVIPGQGLESTYYRLALTNKQGQDFRLDFVRVLMQALSRRIR